MRYFRISQRCNNNCIQLTYSITLLEQSEPFLTFCFSRNSVLLRAILYEKRILFRNKKVICLNNRDNVCILCPLLGCLCYLCYHS